MKKFRFKLEAVERIRKSREQQALLAMAECQQAVREEIARRDAIVESRNGSLQRRESLGAVPVTAAAFALETDYITGSRLRIAQADQAIQRAQRRLEKAMQQYLVARRQTKSIEKLRERAIERHKDEKSKYEQKQLDDIYTMRANLRLAGTALDSEEDRPQLPESEEAAG